MSFRIWTIFYVLAVVGAALATFGPLGSGVALLVLGFWGWVFYASKRRLTLLAPLVVVFIIGVLVMLLLPAVQSARETARRMQCANNLKQLAHAVLDYMDYGPAREWLPPAYVADANGKPMHSWRVLILPYLGEQALYNAYNFNEPWDGPNNSKLVARMPEVFRCPSQQEAGQPGTETNYFAVVDPRTPWPGDKGIRLRNVVDGTSVTIMLIEVSGLGINWMEPRDLTFDEAMELLTTRPRSGHTVVEDGLLTTTYYNTTSRNIAFCDGRVEWTGQFSDAGDARILLTKGGREIGAYRIYFKGAESKTTTVIKWSKVWALSVFVVLVVLPAAWLRRRRKPEASASGVDEDGERNEGTGEPSARG